MVFLYALKYVAWFLRWSIGSPLCLISWLFIFFALIPSVVAQSLDSCCERIQAVIDERNTENSIQEIRKKNSSYNECSSKITTNDLSWGRWVRKMLVGQ